MLDPQARALLDLMAERGVPATHTLTPEEARRLYRERRFFSQPDARALPEVAEYQAASLHGPVALRLFRPETAATPAPVLVYFHGGGWTIGDLDTHDVLCRELAHQGQCAVLSVDYRLGPEARFPAAVDDSLAALHWLRGHGAELGLDTERIAVGGDSAGGNLAAVAALVLRDAASTLKPRLQLLIYPATDMRMAAPSHQHNGQGYLLTADSIRYFRDHYIDDPRHWHDWRASPLLHPNLAGLPPAFVLTAGYDPLRDEGRQYADALSAAGNRVQYLCFERQIHGFLLMGRVLDEANTAVALCGQVLRAAWV